MKDGTVSIVLGIALLVVAATYYSPFPIEMISEQTGDDYPVYTIDGKLLIIDMAGWFGTMLIPLIIIGFGYNKRRKDKP